MSAPAASSGFYGDIQSLTQLRHDAAGGRDGSLEAAAEQFEALFIQMMFKSMRESGIEGGLFDSSQMQTYYQMFDKQVSLDIARGDGLGLSDMLMRQLGGQDSAAGTSPGDNKPAALNLPPRSAVLPPALIADNRVETHADNSVGNLPTPAQMEAASGPAAVTRAPAFAGREDFIATLEPLAEQVARRLDVPARAIVAQSALETGWGQHVMHDAQGRPAWNLFGIKAGDDWQGRSITVPTMEVRDGVAVREVARFRAYDSPAEAVADYERLIGQRERYAEALGSGQDVAAFANALKQAGYATDPDYAGKIERIAGRLEPAAPIQVSEAVAAEDGQAGMNPVKG